MSTIIRASEVGECVYCERAWWLRRVMELEPEGHERRSAGSRLHRRHGLAVRASRLLLVLAVFLLLFATVLLLL
jgi:CRISPR/Cas system-associated exonuclease Cas4 (RecB family)